MNILPPLFENFPAELVHLHQWVLWLLETREAKPTKVPYDAKTGRHASCDAPETWSTFEQARDAYERSRKTRRPYDGIGFQLRPNGDIVGVDWDKATDPETGEVSPGAEAQVVSLDTYTEVSPSGTGLRAFLFGSLPDHGRRKGSIEMYEDGRFLTVTGRRWGNAPLTVNNRHDQILAFHQQIFPPPAKPAPRQPSSYRPAPEDADLLLIAARAKNGANFEALYYRGDVSRYDGDISRGDLALCGQIAFYVQGDEARIDRLFRASALFRPKWDEWRGQQTYGQRTIAAALRGKTEFYSPPGVTQEQARKNQRSYSVPADPIPAAEAAEERTENPQRRSVPEFPMTDLGNGERLVFRHGVDLRYSYERAAWLVYASPRWDWDLTGEIFRRAKDTVRKIYDEASQEPDNERSQSLGKHALRSQSSDRMRAMVTLAQSEPGVAVRLQELDADAWTLNCQNGALDLRTGELRKHRRGDYATKFSPVNYDPAAECPKWQAFLSKVLPDDPNDSSRGKELREYVQKAVGYSLTGDVGEQCLFFLFGHGRNGKSTFSETVSALLGEYWGKTRAETLMQKRDNGIPNDVAALMGLRLVTVSEVNQGQNLNEALVKDLTGGDTISARFMRGEFFNFAPSFKIWMYGNHKPTIKGTDTGIWRRLRLIPFTVQIPENEINPNLPTELREELPGILRWAVEGCIKWKRNGLGIPAEVREATAGYRAEMDVLGAYIEDRCVVGDGLSALAGSLYSDYTKWCEQNGEKPQSQRVFGTALAERGCTRTRVSTGNKWLGIGLQSDGIMTELVPPLPKQHGGDVPLKTKNVPCVPDSDITELLLLPRMAIPENGTQGTQSTPQGTQSPRIVEVDL